MTSSPPAIEFRNLRKVYRAREEERVALEGLSLTVPAGEIFGFAGPNGAGIWRISRLFGHKSFVGKKNTNV